MRCCQLTSFMTAVEGESDCDVVVAKVWLCFIPKGTQRMSHEPKFFQWRVRDSPNLILHLNPKAKGRTLVVGTAPFLFRTSSPVISRVDVIVDRETDLDNWHCCQGWCNLSSPVTFTRNAPETFGKIRFLSILKKRASVLTRCWFYCCDLDDILCF